MACAGSGEAPRGERGKRSVLLTTEYDDARVGDESARDVAAEVGILTDPALDAYVQGVGERLVRFAPRRSFDYRFAVVDQFEPNAFALPGGFIFVSRGLIALVKTEDELANVLGHEIAHAANRHASAIQAVGSRSNPFAMPRLQMARLAAYGRDQERTADQDGQRMAARAGYDPMGLSDFLHRLRDVERLREGHSRLPGFLDTHPGTIERAATCAERAGGLEWRRSPDYRDRHLERIVGLPLGSNPAQGLFDGSRFVHPDLDFQILFPSGWHLVNAQRAVGAQSPDGAAMVVVELDGPARDPRRAAEAFIATHGPELRMRVRKSVAARIGDIEGWRIEASAYTQAGSIEGHMTFVPHAGQLFRITAFAPRGGGKYLSRARNTARTFAPLDAETRAAIPQYRLHVVEAGPGERLADVGLRSGNALTVPQTAVLNGLFVDVRFRGGERVKIARAEPYRP